MHFRWILTKIQPKILKFVQYFLSSASQHSIEGPGLCPPLATPLGGSKRKNLCKQSYHNIRLWKLQYFFDMYFLLDLSQLKLPMREYNQPTILQ